MQILIDTHNCKTLTYRGKAYLKTVKKQQRDLKEPVDKSVSLAIAESNSVVLQFLCFREFRNLELLIFGSYFPVWGQFKGDNISKSTQNEQTIKQRVREKWPLSSIFPKRHDDMLSGEKLCVGCCFRVNTRLNKSITLTQLICWCGNASGQVEMHWRIVSTEISSVKSLLDWQVVS